MSRALRAAWSPRGLPLLLAAALVTLVVWLLAAQPAAAQSDHIPPGLPRSVLAQPGDAKIVLQWRAPASWGSGTPQGYEIDYCPCDTAPDHESGDWKQAVGNSQTIKLSAATDTSFTLTGTYRHGPHVINTITNLTIYHLRVRALTEDPDHAEGSLVGNWVAVSATPQAGCANVITNVAAGDNSLALTWSYTGPEAKPKVSGPYRGSYSVYWRPLDGLALHPLSLGDRLSAGWISNISGGAKHSHGVSSPFTINGLQGGLDYEVRVWGECATPIARGTPTGSRFAGDLKAYDDPEAGVSVWPPRLEIDEGGSATYEVWLSTHPNADVTVTPTLASGHGLSVSFNPTSLTFTPNKRLDANAYKTPAVYGNWYLSQTVTVTVAQNATVDSPQALSVTHVAASADRQYDSGRFLSDTADVRQGTIRISVVDDDCNGCSTPGELGRLRRPVQQQPEEEQEPPQQIVEPQADGGTAPANVRVTPGDGALTVSWSVTPRDGTADGEISHALRWSQQSGVWANPTNPYAGGPEDGVALEAGVSSYTITGLENGTATGVFVRSFTGGSHSERSEHSSQWVRLKGAQTTPVAGRQQQEQPNRAPTVSSALGDVTIVNNTESGMREVSLSGVFSDADEDELSFSAASSDEAVALTWIASDQFDLLVILGNSRGTATVTVTADDGNGGTVSDTFTVTVKAPPVVASALADVSSLQAGAEQTVLLPGVFSDADGDALTISARSSNTATVSVSADSGTLTVTGVAAGTATITVTARDADGNRVSDAFQVSVVAAAPPQEPDPQPQVADPQQQQPEQTPQADVGPEPANVQVVPGDGTLTVSWTVTHRDGVSDGEIRHALRWSQQSGVWANPTDPYAGGPEDGVALAGGVFSYTITGLENGVATGVFVRSFTGSSYSERSEHSSQWLRTKGDHTTPVAE